MGRHDAYSYHSEAGRADGTPGGKERNPERDENKCSRCNELSENVVERAGEFDNQLLCSSCVQALQEEKVRQKQFEVLSTIRDE